MSTKATPLGIRLFLEGVEVPVISAQVNLQPDRPAAATIQIVPTDMALYLLPRTLVHVFFLEDEPLEDPTEPRRPAPGGGVEANLNRFDAPDSQYKLMFVGEIMGYNYGKSTAQRQIILQCMDLSTYWDTCYQWYADYSVGGDGLTDKSRAFVQGGAGLFDSVAGGHKWVIGEILNSKPRTAAYKDVPGLLGGLIHLLESIGGVGGTLGFNGVNDFFTIAELRYNLLGMLGAIAKDDTSAKIYNQKAFFSWLRNGMTSMGSLTSFREIVNHVNSYIYHHIYPNPCSYYLPEETKTVDVPTTVFRDDPLSIEILDRSKRAYTSLSRASNNILVNDILNVSQTFSFINAAWVNIKRAVPLANVLKSDDKKEIYNSLDSVKGILKHAISLAQEAGFDGSTIGGPSFDLAPQLDADVGDALKILDEDIIGVVKESSRVRIKKKTNITSSSRLFNQLFLPECYFVAPPRCNVIFPDQYFQFSFSRNFLREVSRLSMSAGPGNIAGGGRRGSKLFTNHYYAPSTTDVRNKSAFMTNSRGARVLLAHEIHSGIIPKYSWANEGNRWAHLAKKSGRDPFFPDGRVGFLQRMAEFQFYIHRWSARTMSLSGHFNPYLVLGFPALVMDRSLPSPDTVAAREALLGRKWMPVQFLGKLIGLTHNVDQSGGQTQAQFSHCRTHRGLDDDFLSVLSREGTKEIAGQTIKINVQRLLQAQDATIYEKQDDDKIVLHQYISGKLFSGGLIQGTKAYRGLRVDSIVPKGKLLILSAEEEKSLGIDRNATQVVERIELKEDFVGAGTGIIDTGASSEPVLIEVVVDAEEKVLKIYESITIHTVRTVKTGEIITLTQSVEQLLTPNWFSDIWTNKKISKDVYRPLLDTDSITEDISLESGQQRDFFDRTFRDEATVALTEISGEEKETTFTLSEESEVPGNIGGLHIVPGSVEEAVDALNILYSMIRLRNGDIHGFIKQYTRRPIANVEDMLGTYGIEFDDLGNVVVPSNIDNPREGFHSRAYGDYNTDVKLPSRENATAQAGKNALKALFSDVVSGAAVKRGRVTNEKDKTSIRPELDPRGRARARVLAYVQELEFSRGLMG